MCGICGSTRDAEGSAATAMCGALRHRGPDDEGIHVDAEHGLSLGARRLSVIDVGGGHQPLTNEDGSVWAVLNGEIYNHPALQERLRERGHTLRTGTDTEVLVHLYEDYGDALVHALEGMFAFAVWDAPRGRLLLGRDRFGEKPLFYVERGGELTFASELSALTAAGAVDDDVDPVSMDEYFVFGYVPGPRAMLRGVGQVPPASTLVWDRGAPLRFERYWTPPALSAAAPDEPSELHAETRSLLEASVRSRMIADVPLGVFVSGGIDSSVIAAVAASCGSKPIKTFTVGYDVGGVDETDAARALAVEVGADHRELVLTESDVAQRVPPLLASLDQPLADQALVALHAVADLARKEVTVVVGGEGADELFCGYPRYRWLARAERLRSVLPPSVMSRNKWLHEASRLSPRAGRLADLLSPRDAVERHLDWVTDGRRHERMDLYGPALRAGLEPDRVLKELRALVDGDEDHIMSRFMRLDQLHWLPDDVLAKADRAGMLVSLEVRTPYLQRELAEFAASVPPEHHVRTGGKSLLRGVLSELLPGARARPKTAFRVPAREWLRGPLAPVMSTQLREGSLYKEGWFDRGRVGRLVDDHMSGARDCSHTLWSLLALGLWLDALRTSRAG